MSKHILSYNKLSISYFELANFQLSHALSYTNSVCTVSGLYDLLYFNNEK